MSFFDNFKNSLDKDSHSSPFGEAGLMFDPLYHLTGGDKGGYAKFMRKTWELPNKELSPYVKKFHELERKNPWINPLQAEIDKTSFGSKIKDYSEDKPGDAALAIMGSIFGGGALLGGLGGGGAGGGIGGGAGAGGGMGGSQGGLGFFSNGGQGGMAGVGQGNVGQLFANTGINTGGVGAVGGTGATTPGLADIIGKGGFGSMPGMSTGVPGQQQQAAPPPQFNPPPPSNVEGLTPPDSSYGWQSRVGLGLNRARNALTPLDPRMTEGMDPQYIEQMRKQAIMRMGLGMMSASGRGGNFGESLAAGLGHGQGAFNKDIEGAYQRGVDERADKRALSRQDLLDQRYTDEQNYSRGRDVTLDKRAEDQMAETKRYHDASLASLENRARAKAPGVTMSDKAIDFAARRLLNGEPANKVLANFGRGAQGAQNITAVQNRLADLADEGQVSPQLMAVIGQELAANSRTRLELGAREGKIASRVEEAKQFAKIAGDASLKVPRGKFVPVSRLLQFSDTQLSDPELAAFKAANVSLINAYAAAVGGGVPTVHDKEAAEAMLSTAQSPEAYQAVVNQLITEMDAALAAPRNVMDEMRIHDTGSGLGHPGAPPQGVVNWADLN